MKDSSVVPVHKKDSMSDPNNYRPISLLSNVGKLMERCIHKQGKEIRVVFCDISKSFDRVWHRGYSLNLKA